MVWGTSKESLTSRDSEVVRHYVDEHVHDASVAARRGLESELETFCLRHSTDLTISVAQN